MREIAEELLNAQWGQVLVAEEVVLDLVEVVLRVWIPRGLCLVLRTAAYAVLAGDDETGMQISHVFRAANDVEAQEALA